MTHLNFVAAFPFAVVRERGEAFGRDDRGAGGHQHCLASLGVDSVHLGHGILHSVQHVPGEPSRLGRQLCDDVICTTAKIQTAHSMLGT